jgi:hypothetical protein
MENKRVYCEPKEDQGQPSDDVTRREHHDVQTLVEPIGKLWKVSKHTTSDPIWGGGHIL